MATHQDPIRLTNEQLRLLGELAARTGKTAQDLLDQALKEFHPSDPAVSDNKSGATLFEQLSRSGLLGCLNGGPTDLSTNPEHMEGFGE